MTIEKPTFFAQLKQRHVFRVAAMYAVTAWLLVQVGSSTFEPLGFPGWSQRALIILIALGFPIALVLAWIFDVTPEGVIRGSTATPIDGLSRGRKLDIVIIVVLIAALAVTLLWRREPSNAIAPTIVDASVAVLPFDPIGTDPSLKPLGEALAAQITNDLAGRSELRVASRTSAFEQGGKDAVAIAHALRVSYVLEGSVRPAEQRVRVTAQLVRGSDGLHLWSGTYDVTGEEIDTTAMTVANMVHQYTDLERSLQQARLRTRSQAAYDYLESAQKKWGTIGPGDPKGYRQILDDSDRAIALDPDFVPALQSRAAVYLNKVGFTACGARCPAEARRSIEHALTVQPDDADVLRQLARLQLYFDLDPAAAEATLDRIRQIDPDALFLNVEYASLAMFRGDLREARDYVERQIKVTPYAGLVYFYLAMIERAQGDVVGAEHAFDMTMRLAAGELTYGLAATERISLLIDRGDLEKANAEFEPLWSKYRLTIPVMVAPLLGRLGHQSEARELVSELTQDPTSNPFNIFQAYFALGEYDEALKWMRRTIEDRGVFVTFFRLPHQWVGLQEQPGYADALKYLESLQKSR